MSKQTEKFKPRATINPRTNNRTTINPTTINPKLNQNLAAYVAAACAAGVGLLAAAYPAEAKVVYTATNISIGARSTVPLDLNNDGVVDFSLVTRFCGSHSTCLVLEPAVTGNGFRGAGSVAAAGFFGVPVGPGEKFQSGTYPNLLAVAGSYGSSKWSGGPWASVTNRYLGLSFVVGGQIHYGWARLSVKLHGGPTVLTGYAYQTVPNASIIEGHISGGTADNLAPADLLAPISQPATLGMLARGADSLVLWRRKDDVVAR